MEKWIAIWGIVAIVSMLAGAVLAYTKRLDASFWAAVCFIFPPALIILALLSRNRGQRPKRPSIDADDGYSEYRD